MNSFIKAMQFALKEYICVSSGEEQQDTGSCCFPSNDDIHASAFGVFHSHVIFFFEPIFTSFLPIWTIFYFRPEILGSPWEVVDIRYTIRRLPTTILIVQNAW